MDCYRGSRDLGKFVPNNFAVGLLMMGILACERPSNDQAKVDQKAFKELENAEVSVDIKKEEIEQIIQGLPSPSEVPVLLRKTGAGFNPGLPNTFDQLDSYRSTNFKASLNLGVYAADIGYLCSYGKSQVALDYLENSKILADHMGVTTAFDMQFVRKFEDSIGSPDYLLELIDQSIDRVSQYLRTEDRTNLSVLVLAGGFIEGFYLTTNMLLLYPQASSSDQEIIDIHSRIHDLAFHQKDHLAPLVDLLSTVEEGDSPIGDLIVQLEDLNVTLAAEPVEPEERNQWVRNLNEKALKIRAQITG